MGLTVSVYRDADGTDCTNNGISSRFIRLTVVNVEGPEEPSEKAPAVILDSHVNGIVRIVPAVFDPKLKVYVKDRSRAWMSGGNYAATCDSRFSRKIEALTKTRFYGAVAIHDRHEGF
jgi:hypothetical protein